jgi:hypothetical protein
MAAVMLKMLRAMNSWELAEVCRAAGVPEGARPEEIIRTLGGTWWAAPWGAAEEERVLLLRAAEALNLMPRLHRFRHQLGLVERMVYATLIQQAFVAAPEEQQSALLTSAETYLEGTPPALPAPAPAVLSPEERRHLSLQRLVSTGAGLRAVTVALTEVPVLPETREPRPGPTALFTALASAGPEAWSGRVVEWVRARKGPDLRALFQILHLCWRQRQRLLVELRASRASLEDEEKRLLARLQSLALEDADARRRLPWHRRADTGAAVTIGAMGAALAELVLTGSIHGSAFAAASAGCAWTLTGLLASARTGDSSTRRALLEGLRRARRQRLVLEHQIGQLQE